MDQEPDTWFAELEAIKLELDMDFQVKWDDIKIIKHILYNIIPKEYDIAVHALKRDFNSDQNKLTLKQVKDEIRQAYANLKVFTQTQKNSKDHEKKGHETVLLDKQNKRKYQGNTNFKKVRFNKRQIKTDCNVCGKKGHKGVDCWENPKNAHKRPKNWKSKAEKSNSALIADTKTATKNL